jgi:hypothetical protein
MSKIDTGQTVEEAALEAALFEDYYYNEDLQPHYIKGFKRGAKWQAKQSPWVSVEERLPEDCDYSYLVAQDVDGLGTIIVSEMVFIDGKWYEMSLNEEQAIPKNASKGVIAWRPMPTFDQILESNKDVLRRMKENGD